MADTNWHVYIILCSDESLYTGITTEIGRRFNQHATGRGARYFRGRRPRQLVYLESGHTRCSASRRESEIKGMTRNEKSEMIAEEKTRRECSDGICPGPDNALGMCPEKR